MNNRRTDSENYSAFSEENVESFVVPKTSKEEGLEHPNLPLTPEKEKEFNQCLEVLLTHKKNVPRVAKAIATIEREGYYAYYSSGEFKDTNDFIQKVFGFDRTYIYRMKKYGKLLFDENIPEGKEPSETSVREMLKECFSDKERKEIYQLAQAICRNRQKKETAKNSENNAEKDTCDAESSDSDGESKDCEESTSDASTGTEIPEQMVPEAKDFRKALTEFKNKSDRIYFPQLDSKSYPKCIAFSEIVKENAEKIKTARLVLDCFRHYKIVTGTKVVDLETGNFIRVFINKLISDVKEEMEDLLQSKSPALDTEAN